MLNNIHFALEGDAEFPFDALKDLLAEGIDLGPCGVAIVYEDEGLVGIAAGVALSVSLPTRSLYEPARG